MDLISANDSIDDLVGRLARAALNGAGNRIPVLAKYEDRLATRAGSILPLFFECNTVPGQPIPPLVDADTLLTRSLPRPSRRILDTNMEGR